MTCETSWFPCGFPQSSAVPRRNGILQRFSNRHSVAALAGDAMEARSQPGIRGAAAAGRAHSNQPPEHRVMRRMMALSLRFIRLTRLGIRAHQS